MWRKPRGALPPRPADVRRGRSNSVPRPGHNNPLDEPTAALGVAQTRQVLDLVRRLADHGLGVVLISHNMADVLEVSDRITALYPGRVAADVRAADVNHGQVVELITAGRSGSLGLAPTDAPV